MLPSLTNRIEPGISARGSTTTTFEGVGVRMGPPSPPTPGTDGREPPSRPKETTATITRPRTESAGATSNGRRRPPVGDGVERRGGVPRVTSGFRCEPDGRAGPDRERRRLEDRPRLGVMAGDRGVADLELERFDPAEAAAPELCDDVDDVALGDVAGELGPAERDPVEDVQPALEDQLGVAAAARLADTGHGQAEDRDEGLRIAGAAGREAEEVAVEGVVHVAAADRQVDGEARHGLRRARCLGEGHEPLTELGPALGGDLESCRAGMAAVAEEQVR